MGVANPPNLKRMLLGVKPKLDVLAAKCCESKDWNICARINGKWFLILWAKSGTDPRGRDIMTATSCEAHFAPCCGKKLEEAETTAWEWGLCQVLDDHVVHLARR